ncbi:hypothetical protein [Streptomyces sp. NPDC057677]
MSHTARLLASAAYTSLGLAAALDLSLWAFVHLAAAVLLFPFHDQHAEP